MKLLVIGCGQCGGRIADEFARLNIKAHVQRGINITTGIFAVNTDVADLSGLRYIKSGYQSRILIGNQKTGGHGVGKINELGAEIAREDGDKIIDAIGTAPRFAETDAFLIAASAAGGTGSGAIPVLTHMIKERYMDKPVYDLIVLPFKHEELTEERTVYNSATCLKSSYLVADAVFLVDNQRYIGKSTSIKNNLAKINATVVEPFYDLLCAGEEKKPEFIGSKLLDAGDIIQTLLGWTVIGHGTMPIPRFSFFSFGSKNAHHDFRDKVGETHRGIHALELAINELSLKCNPIDARRGLYLIAAPSREINMDLIGSLGASLKGLAKDAILRSGDYPRNSDSVNVTIILSELSNAPKIVDYFNKAINYLHAGKRQWMGMHHEQKSIEDTFKEIPSLL